MEIKNKKTKHKGVRAKANGSVHPKGPDLPGSDEVPSSFSSMLATTECRRGPTHSCRVSVLKPEQKENESRSALNRTSDDGPLAACRLTCCCARTRGRSCPPLAAPLSPARSPAPRGSAGRASGVEQKRHAVTITADTNQDNAAEQLRTSFSSGPASSPEILRYRFPLHCSYFQLIVSVKPCQQSSVVVLFNLVVLTHKCLGLICLYELYLITGGSRIGGLGFSTWIRLAPPSRVRPRRGPVMLFEHNTPLYKLYVQSLVQ